MFRASQRGQMARKSRDFVISSALVPNYYGQICDLNCLQFVFSDVVGSFVAREGVLWCLWLSDAI